MHQKLTIIFLFVSICAAFGQSRTLNLDNAVVYRDNDLLNRQKLTLFYPSAKERKDLARNLVLNRAALSSIWEAEPESFTTTIPLPEGQVESFTFVRNRISTEPFVLETSDGRRLQGKEYQGIHYKLAGEGHIGGLSFREDGVMGVLTHKNGTYNIGETAPGLGQYAIVNDQTQGLPGWTCGNDEALDVKIEGPTKHSDKAAATSCKVVRIYFEADNDLYKKSGNSLTTASNFVNGLFNIVAQIYANESITVQISGVYVWTGVDPYALLTNPNTVLLNFATNRVPASVNGHLTHLLSTRSAGMGGIAYTGVLCNTLAIHGFSNIYYSYSALPTYSWSVGCVAHEIGHNFGSKHTHWCGWSLPNGTTGRIDSCASGEAYNGVSCGVTQKARKGTVMSYCHITLGGIDLNLGFGPLPGNAIRNGLAAATCISGTSCLGTASLSVDSATNKNNSYTLKVTVPSNHNAVSWKLMEGSTQVQTGTLSSLTTGTTVQVPISGKANGTYNYSVILTSATGATTTSTSLAVVVAVPAPAVITGNCVANGLMAWFAADGKLNFKFAINSTCATYAVYMCRYNLTNPNVAPTGTETPAACSIRNSMTAYNPTTAEKTLGYVERVANPQPGNMTGSPAGSYWYSVDVVCNGTACTTANRTRTYIFVPGN